MQRKNISEYLLFMMLVCPDALMEMVKKVTMNPVIPANILTSIRALNNLFKNIIFHQWLQYNRSKVCPFHSLEGSCNRELEIIID